MAGDINELAEKKFKSRIRKLKKVLKSEEEKEKFFDQLGASVEIYLPSKKPEEEGDSVIFYTTIEGKIIDAEYSYNQGEEVTSIPVSDKDLDVIRDVFGNGFKLE
ncbi:hypothetical protein [Methanobrevibacter filiformis]|uniref:Uncharacterized protein n=1 Tax=Methanobrevibacter filiformis TaxID=55758 RepID=A0A165ZH83_9EURY|nr:hypothetical protein [Methanobrevibacter filiformis]KZX10714.1 hypothetical protein MBFIL_16260 [Methanobrevibacter filiformis]